jgi:predicted lysophospholipase L1 biosynthesis ABC-type transport system permease subunit
MSKSDAAPEDEALLKGAWQTAEQSARKPVSMIFSRRSETTVKAGDAFASCRERSSMGGGPTRQPAESKKAT